MQFINHKERLQAIIDRIKSDPACWNQGKWHCGSSHCVAGHAQIDSGNKIDGDRAFEDGKRWLGLSAKEAEHLFHPGRTLEEIETFAASFERITLLIDKSDLNDLGEYVGSHPVEHVQGHISIAANLGWVKFKASLSASLSIHSATVS